MTLIELALAFVLRHPAVTSAIIGPRTMEHLESQLGAADVELSDDVLDRIDEIVPPGVNVPGGGLADRTDARLDRPARRDAGYASLTSTPATRGGTTRRSRRGAAALKSARVSRKEPLAVLLSVLDQSPIAEGSTAGAGAPQHARPRRRWPTGSATTATGSPSTTPRRRSPAPRRRC